MENNNQGVPVKNNWQEQGVSPELVELPKVKKNPTLVSILGGIAAVLLVAGVATATYFVSNRISGRVAVAPNAPASQPLAAGCSGTYSDCKTTIYPFYDCQGNCQVGVNEGKCCKPLKTCSGNYSCTVSTSGKICQTGTCQTGSQDGQCCCTANCSGDQCGQSNGCGGTCPSGDSSTPGKCGNPAAGGYCSGSASSCGSCRNSGSTPSCVKDCGSCNGVSASWWKECADSACAAPTAPPSGGTGGGSGSTCNSVKDTPSSNSITFSRAGNVILFTRNTAGTVTLTGPKTVTISATNGDAVQQATKFAVNAGETYTIKVRLANENADAVGWRPNKSASICGPSNSACGGDANIDPVKNLANANSDTTGITAGGTAANIQCWGDKIQNDLTQDYDFNDFTLIFGYEKSTREALCDTANPATISKSTISAGESVTVTSYANDAAVTGFFYAMYNIDNLYPAPPAGNPKPVCVTTGTGAADPTQCPNGGHVLIFTGQKDTANPKKGSATVTYAQVFDVTDTNTGQKPRNVKFSGYFSKSTGGAWSFPDGQCQVLLHASTLSTLPNCKDITGPDTITLGASANYTATFVQSASGGLTDGSIFLSNTTGATYVDSKDIVEFFFFKVTGDRAVANGGTKTATFTPTAVGKYWLRCRAWNDGIAECRPPATVATAPTNSSISACSGPNYEKLVTVVAPVAGPACTLAKVAYLEKSTGNWIKITNDQIGTYLRSGDTMRLYATGNASVTKARFIVTVTQNGAARSVTYGDADVKKEGADYYVEFLLTDPGSYTFVAEVQ